MTNQNTTYFDKRFMNVRPAFIPDTQAAKLMQPTQRAFDSPSENAQATAIYSSLFNQNRFNQRQQLSNLRLPINHF